MLPCPTTYSWEYSSLLLELFCKKKIHAKIITKHKSTDMIRSFRFLVIFSMRLLSIKDCGSPYSLLMAQESSGKPWKTLSDKQVNKVAAHCPSSIQNYIVNSSVSHDKILRYFNK